MQSVCSFADAIASYTTFKESNLVHFMPSTRRRIVTQFAAAAVLALTACSSFAADLYGGGSTFSAQAYVGDNFLRFTPDRRLSRNIPSPPAPINATNAAANSFASLTSATTVFGAYGVSTGHRISYCQTGSGTGKTLLVGTGAITNATGKCGGFSFVAPPAVDPDAPAGFSAIAAAPDYVGTDSPITQADATSFTAGPRSARNGLFQIPTIAGTIALPRSTNLNYPNLTISQVCQIYSGRITNWVQIPNAGITAPIRVVYRSDNSGTSYAFTNFLANNCNGNFGVPAGYFKPNQNYAAAVPAVPGQPGSTAPLYAASASASGNPGVVSNVVANTNSTGYADYAEVAAQSAEFPRVNTVSPATPTASGTLTISVPLPGQVLNASNVPVAVTGIANPNCIRLINPSTIPIGVTYPILAYTYINGYFGGNAANRTALRSLLGFFLSTEANRPTLPPGYFYLDGGSSYRSSIQNTINTCINS